MGKSSPPPVDYTAAAQSQGAANKETAIAQANLNNPNTVTPYGSSTYSGVLDGSGRGTVTQTLSPAEQQKLDASNGIQLQSLGILGRDMPNIESALSGSFGMAGSPIQGFDPKYGIGTTQTGADYGAAGPIQSGLNYGGSPGLVGTDEATRKAFADSVYGQGKQYLDPQFASAQSDQDAKLANQGILPGSEAYKRANDELALQKQQAYGDLSDRAIQGGMSAMGQQQQAALANRGQISGETTQAGQFLNSAQQQGMNQILAALQQNNAGVAQQANISGQSAQLANQGRQQAFQEYAANRTMPINMLTSLLSGSQVNNPTFAPITPTGINAAPIMQGAMAQGQSNAAQSSASAGLMGSLGGAAMTAAAIF
jgi:hypothetical protein